MVTEIGTFTGSNNVAYSGIWASTIYVGGSGPDTATYVISGSTITLVSGGSTTTITPTGISVANGASTMSNNVISTAFYVCSQFYTCQGHNGTTTSLAAAIAAGYNIYGGIIAP